MLSVPYLKSRCDEVGDSGYCKPDSNCIGPEVLQSGWTIHKSPTMVTGLRPPAQKPTGAGRTDSSRRAIRLVSEGAITVRDFSSIWCVYLLIRNDVGRFYE